MSDLGTRTETRNLSSGRVLRVRKVSEDSETALIRATTSNLTWLLDATWEELHYAPGFTVRKWKKLVENGERPVRTICGDSIYATAPGISSRMSLVRCPRCCEALGIPQGNGTGLNDLGKEWHKYRTFALSDVETVYTVGIAYPDPKPKKVSRV